MIEQIVTDIFPGLTPGQQDAANALARTIMFEKIYDECPQAREQIVADLRLGRTVVWLSLEGALVSTPGGGLDIYRFGRLHQFKNNLRFKDAVYVFGCAGLSALPESAKGTDLKLDRIMHKNWWDQFLSN
jgi:hypothetical protein